MDVRTIIAIREEEGKRLKVYEDTLGNPTAGIGHLVLPVDELKLGDIISEERCKSLFLADLKKAEDGAKRVCRTWNLKNQLPMVLHVLTCMVFQMGRAGVLKFRKFLAALQRQNYIVAAAEMLDSRWAKQTPRRAYRLANEIASLNMVDGRIPPC